MGNDETSLLVILGMALVTYLSRAGGLWVMNRVTITPQAERWLRALPGALIVSIVAPLFFASGLREFVAGVVTVLAARYSQNLIVAMGTGVASIWLLRNFF